jgi:hypothetical protein
MQSTCRERGVGTGDHQKDCGVIKLAQKFSSGWVRDEMVGCRTGEHREKARGIDHACVEDLPVTSQRSDAHEHGRANHPHERSDYVYDTVCRELAGSVLR